MTFHNRESFGCTTHPSPILSVAIHIEKILKKIVAFLSLLSHTYFTASMKLTFFFFYF